MNLTIMPVEDLPLIRAGDDLPAMKAERCVLRDGDIVTIASSVYSKANGYTRKLTDITPTARAERIAKMTGEEPRFLQSILDASEDVLIEFPFILSEVKGGHIGVRAGVDQSNIEGGLVILLPPDPMKAAEEVRNALKKSPERISASSSPIPAGGRFVGARPAMPSAGAACRPSGISGATRTSSATC
jgi:coenzyme F420-0:L-glutamate ligase/coenzyme F420-1:gamma-L-glutamate ligase